MVDLSRLAGNWEVILPQGLFSRLHSHLFPGDHDEHGAVIEAGLAIGSRSVRLLAREVYPAQDGYDYVPGKRGYRMLKADFIAERIQHCRDQGFAYLAVHNHGAGNEVGFSADDLRSHERGYPALLDIADGLPVGALVFAENAVAGDIWLPGERRVALAGASVVGPNLRRLTPTPPQHLAGRDAMYDRQARLFGNAGQEVLARTKVGLIGLGGAGSLLAEYLGRLGVGNFVLVDPERAELSNLPRLVAASRFDVLPFLGGEHVPLWLRNMSRRWAASKVSLARRNILRANPKARVDAIFGDFLEAEIAARFVDCDYLFLAADTMNARLLFNAIAHQYLVPGVQVGAKVHVDQAFGDVLDAYSVVRPVTSESGCLLCNRLINSAKLQEESVSRLERQQQRYIDEPEIIAPSVITLNAIATAHAANDFLFYITGLREPQTVPAYLRFQSLGRRYWLDEPRKTQGCLECGTGERSRLARGDGCRLPVIQRN
jgi:molybdopterin/thiamine biosynthesis adenylyltransferase